MSESEREAIIEECFAYEDTLRRGGHWTRVGEALQSSRAAKTLRSKGGKIIVAGGCTSSRVRQATRATRVSA